MLVKNLIDFKFFLNYSIVFNLFNSDSKFFKCVNRIEVWF